MSHASGSGTATLLLRAKWEVFSHVIQLRGHDEVILVQPFDLLGLEGHRRVAPAEADIRVMPLSFCEFSHLPDKGERFGKILERIRPLDPPSLILDCPMVNLLPESCNFIRRERRIPCDTGYRPL
jgi:hypothetical protein